MGSIRKEMLGARAPTTPNRHSCTHRVKEYAKMVQQMNAPAKNTASKPKIAIVPVDVDEMKAELATQSIDRQIAVMDAKFEDLRNRMVEKFGMAAIVIEKVVKADQGGSAEQKKEAADAIGHMIALS